MIAYHRIALFISHSWLYSGHYRRLVQWVFDRNWSTGDDELDFTNHSVPQNDPVHDGLSDSALKDAIFQKISQSHVVIIPTGMYATYSGWIQKEIDGAIEYNKPILAVDPWGEERRSSAAVIESADVLVGWTEQKVIGGIWELFGRRR